MKTYLDCIPCFLKQTLTTGRIATDDEFIIREMLNTVGQQIASFPHDGSPPLMGQEIYGTIRKLSGVNDPYLKFKKAHIQQALQLYPKLEELIEKSEDPLLTAIRIAIAGNVIDLGMSKAFDMEKDLQKILHQNMAICDILEFKNQLSNAKHILYLGDNAGESVFDKILIKALNKPVTYVVRDKPVINDVTIDDAIASGIDSVANIISSGIDAPGILIDLCPPEFQAIFNQADLIISKGQGNYESLSETNRPVFFLLKAKCHVIAKHLMVDEDDIILKKSQFWS